MINKYQHKIQTVLGCFPEVRGEYNLFTTSTLEIHPDDVDTFRQLFSVTINNNYGQGELALYWLLEHQGIMFDEKNINDLVIENVPIEIKKYYKSKLVQIGRIPRKLSPKLVDLQRLMFFMGIDQLITHINKVVFKDILKESDEFRTICMDVVKQTLEHKIGSKGYIINFKSPILANIYMVDIQKLDIDILINNISFNQGCLYMDLEKIFGNEIN